jgi:hypothetical protein
MARYRIVRLPHPDAPGDTLYEVHEWEPILFGLGRWDYIERFDRIENAKQYVAELFDVYRVVKEYQ